MSFSQLQLLVNFYLREGYLQKVQNACNDALQKRSTEALPLFWRAHSLIEQGTAAEALRELQVLHSSPEFGPASIAAAIRAHESAKVRDHEALADLAGRLEMEERVASQQALLLLALYYWHARQLEKARSILTHILGSFPDNLECQVSFGWVLFTAAGRHDEVGTFPVDPKEALQHFDVALATNSGHLEAVLGKAACLEHLGQPSQAAALVTEAAARHTWFPDCLALLARLHAAAGAWDRAVDVAARLRQQDPANIPALQLMLVHTLAREGRTDAAAQLAQELLAALESQERRSAALHVHLAQPLARIATGDSPILRVATAMLERAVKVAPNTVAYLVELARLRAQQGDHAPALALYRRASELDELNMAALHGAIECELLSGQVEEAFAQLEFLAEVGAQGGRPGELHYLQALLAWKRGEHHSKVEEHLDRAVEQHLEQLAGAPGGLPFYVALDAPRLLAMARLQLQLTGGQPRLPNEPIAPGLTKCQRLLDVVLQHAPGLGEAVLMAARVHHLMGEHEAAMRKAGAVLQAAPKQLEAHLIIANSLLSQDLTAAAASALDAAVAADFSVRESAGYCLARARVLEAEGRLEEAARLLEAAMAVPGMSRGLTDTSRKKLMASGKKVAECSLHERAAVHILLAQVLARSGKTLEASKVIQDALREFQGTVEEVQVTLANAQLAVARGDVTAGLDQLGAVSRESPLFLRARMAMADIYLHHRADRHAYARCYAELAARYGDAQSQRLLGEALLQIQEPEHAIKALQAAQEQEPKDMELALKLGRALVVTHDYRRALDFLARAVRLAPGKRELVQEQAALLLRLRQWDAAERVLAGCLQQGAGAAGVEGTALDVTMLLLLAKAHQGRGNLAGYEEVLHRADGLQAEVMVQLRGEHPDVLAAQKEVAADICFRLGEHYEGQRDRAKAIEMYKRAVGESECHSQAALALARLHMAAGEEERCQEVCVALLGADPDNVEAQQMLAQLLFQQEQYESAVYHFQQLLERQPSRYSALAQLLQLLRRAGRLEEAPDCLARAAAAVTGTTPAGLHFCNGLHARFGNRMRDALREFNAARKDAEWGTRAAYQMVDMYLLPELERVWTEDAGAEKQQPQPQQDGEAVRAARRLLQEVRAADQGSVQHKVLQCYTQMAGGEKAEIESALAGLLELASADRDSVTVLLALATAFTLLKQQPKARNQLKRIQKMRYATEEGDEFERAWLLLAEIHIQGGKYDLAQDLCKRCVKCNSSCGKAWELLGAIMEREQSYKDAAEHYEYAWKYENEASAVIGYKLAFNYLKAKRFVDAIDVCYKVLTLDPEYPKIRKDILERARACLRL